MATSMHENKENQPFFLYDQVKSYLKNLIEFEELKAGMKLPNESELCEMFKTSRITVRRALKELADDGLVEVLHGKGTFVKERRTYTHNINLNGFTEDMRFGGQGVRKIILEKKVITSDTEMMTVFDRTEPFSLVKLKRLIMDGENVYSVDNAFFPCDLYPGIEDKIEDDVSTFALIKKEYGVRFKNVSKELVVITPNKDLADLLKVTAFETVIQVKKLIRNPEGIPIHFSRYYLPSKRVRLHFEVDIDDAKATE